MTNYYLMITTTQHLFSTFFHSYLPFTLVHHLPMPSMYTFCKFPCTIGTAFNICIQSAYTMLIILVNSSS